MAKIGIFGGSFNPPHSGHIMAAKAALEALSLDRLIFLPSNIPPHKPMPIKTAAKEQRLYMTHLAAKEVGGEVSAMELIREGKSYTKDSIAEFKRLYPKDKLYFILGTDMLKSFLSWSQPEEILKHATLAALCRDEEERENMKVYAKNIQDALGGSIILIDNFVVKVSSTDIRAKESLLLPYSIAKYIEENGLYI